LPLPLELSARLDTLIVSLEKQPTRIFFGLVPLKSKNERIKALIDRILKVQSDLLLFNGTISEYQALRTEVIECERSARFPMTVWQFLGLIILFFLVLGIFGSPDVWKAINGYLGQLGVTAPGQLIGLGIAGAVLYFAIEHLQNAEALSKESKVVIYSIRLFLAVVVPIVLVALFFGNVTNDPKTNTGGLSRSSEILSFACGYSAKVVVIFFNKIVEKAIKMIHVI
jgi:hypothetical protein